MFFFFQGQRRHILAQLWITMSKSKSFIRLQSKEKARTGDAPDHCLPGLCFPLTAWFHLYSASFSCCPLSPLPPDPAPPTAHSLFASLLQLHSLTTPVTYCSRSAFRIHPHASQCQIWALLAVQQVFLALLSWVCTPPPPHLCGLLALFSLISCELTWHTTHTDLLWWNITFTQHAHFVVCLSPLLPSNSYIKGTGQTPGDITHRFSEDWRLFF